MRTVKTIIREIGGNARQKTEIDFHRIKNSKNSNVENFDSKLIATATEGLWFMTSSL